MRSVWIVGATAVLAASLAACSKSDTPNQNPTSAPPTTHATVRTSPTGQAATPPDPCVLVTQSEASALTGTSFGPGKEESENAASRRCVYGAQTKDVFMVIVARGTSVDEAKAVKDQMLAEAQQNGVAINLTKVTGLGDDAYSVNKSLSANGVTISISGIYVLSGVTGFGLVDEKITGPAPTVAAMVTQAQTVISRL
jgi:hypothetical protein